MLSVYAFETTNRFTIAYLDVYACESQCGSNILNEVMKVTTIIKAKASWNEMDVVVHLKINKPSRICLPSEQAKDAICNLLDIYPCIALHLESDCQESLGSAPGGVRTRLKRQQVTWIKQVIMKAASGKCEELYVDRLGLHTDDDIVTLCDLINQNGFLVNLGFKFYLYNKPRLCELLNGLSPSTRLENLRWTITGHLDRKEWDSYFACFAQNLIKFSMLKDVHICFPLFPFKNRMCYTEVFLQLLIENLPTHQHLESIGIDSLPWCESRVIAAEKLNPLVLQISQSYPKLVSIRGVNLSPVVRHHLRMKYWRPFLLPTTTNKSSMLSILAMAAVEQKCKEDRADRFLETQEREEDDEIGPTSVHYDMLREYLIPFGTIILAKTEDDQNVMKPIGKKRKLSNGQVDDGKTLVHTSSSCNSR